eukprot:366430-Chlamydomonas_euryale.AAC.2
MPRGAQAHARGAEPPGAQRHDEGVHGGVGRGLWMVWGQVCGGGAVGWRPSAHARSASMSHMLSACGRRRTRPGALNDPSTVSLRQRPRGGGRAVHARGGAPGCAAPCAHVLRNAGEWKGVAAAAP